MVTPQRRSVQHHPNVLRRTRHRDRPPGLLIDERDRSEERWKIDTVEERRQRLGVVAVLIAAGADLA